MKTPACPYCGEAAQLVSRADVVEHPHGLAWECTPCEAWIACFSNSPSHKPMGRLAKDDLHHAKKVALRSFNKIRKAWGVARVDAFLWLADNMQIPISQCDFDKFDLSQCVQADLILKRFIPNFRGETNESR